ncbi:hypothetical protein ACQPZG_12895 [Streptomyces sp. CA-294286]|uniref:hypothetical protein n=1 Tax=Streptomyces sp. CA-294286 TaxID=3240070 RepID=UPI003D930924
MFVFACAACGTELTTPLSRVALPVHAHQTYGNGLQLPVLMDSGTFAVDSEPGGRPWRWWEAVDAGGAEAHGSQVPVDALPDDQPSGAIVVAPGDTRGTVLIPERAGGHCCGLDGADGPNMACAACGLPVASRIDDCSLWQAAWFVPGAVRRLAVDGLHPAPLTWSELWEEGEYTPLFEPIGTWGPGSGTDHFWSWSPRWEAAAGWALAHLLVASEGRPVTVPDGLVKEVFQRTLDALLPVGPQPMRAVTAGPGRPAPGPDADIVLVPTHPQTGETWAPSGPAAAAHRVPLPFGVWLGLALPRPHLPAPASGTVPRGVVRDDPPPPHPRTLFRADAGILRHTLDRLPAAARSPWLRELSGRVAQHVQAGAGLF